MSSPAPGQELPPPPFAGGSVCAFPPPPPIAPQHWLRSIWAATGALDAEDAQRPQDHFYDLDIVAENHPGSEDPLSKQLYRNKQLQDTLLQKEEELARLHEENNQLRQFLNSALVKQLEEKTKQLLWESNQKTPGPLKSSKRRLRVESSPVSQESSHPQKARRNLLGDFSACGEPTSPPVDNWILETLGLKDVDTIDESPASANYSALSLAFDPGCSHQGPGGATDFTGSHGQLAVYREDVVPPVDPAREEPSPFLLHVPSSPCLLAPTRSDGSSLPPGLSGNPSTPSPGKMDVAFSTSLSPHCNVKTHTFRQGQAFVRRDEDGGWKLTWVPKQPE